VTGQNYPEISPTFPGPGKLAAIFRTGLSFRMHSTMAATFFTGL